MSYGKAENFILKDQYGNDFELYKNLDGYILLIFYPKDNSLVCSKQLSNYQLNINKFKENGIQPVGINIETIGSHRLFCGNKNINFPILSDPDKIVSEKLNALNFLSVNKRKLVLINSKKEIVYQKSNFTFNYTKTDKIIEELRILHIV
jgi:peroxiredoxin Q/BCP